MSKDVHIYLQALLSIMQYILPVFVLTNMTTNQKEAITLSIAVLQGLVAVNNHPSVDSKQGK